METLENEFMVLKGLYEDHKRTAIVNDNEKVDRMTSLDSET